MAVLQNNILAGAAGQGGAAEYVIPKSLRFNSGDSADLRRTPATAGNTRTFTLSFWTKRSKLGAHQRLFSTLIPGTSQEYIRFNSDDTLRLFETFATLETAQQFRDLSAWYHIVVAVDSTQATASDRVKLYVNGAQVTQFGGGATYPSQNATCQFNTTVSHQLGSGTVEYYDGLIADFQFVDGQQLSASDLGETRSSDGVWVPKEFTGSYGTNGFHLNFSDSSTNEALGFDSAPTTPDPDPKKGMDVITYTGTYARLNVGGLNFEPGLVWIKNRDSGSSAHFLADSVRGGTKVLQSNSTGAENTRSNHILSFNPDGFTLGADGTSNYPSGNSFVAWTWRAGGAAVANTDGTITSQVSANTDYGFSIITYSGNGTSGATVGHGLTNQTPKFIIVKRRDSTGRWAVYYDGMSTGDYIYLDLEDAKANDSAGWPALPSSSVFTISNNSNWNNSSGTYVAYCWSEVSGYSKFGTYTGNGSTTGPTITCGFKPRWILVKNTSSSSTRWIVWDTERDDDTLDKGLSPNLSNAEVTGFNANVLSDGFQIVDAETTLNENNSTFIFAAFADRPGNNWDVNNIVTNEGLTTSKTQFDIALWDGNGSSQSIDSLGFQPDFVWIKNRNGAHNHMLFDVVRGAGADLQSNSTATEGSAGSNDLTSFDSSGFSLGSNNAVNQSSRNYVAWCWKAGGTAASNTDGSITSSVSANAAYGFSIVTYTGTGSNATVGHGLNKAPGLILIKRRNGSGSWSVYHSALGATQYVRLNRTDAAASSVGYFNDTEPTTSVFSIGTTASVNSGSSTYVAYCFANVPGYQRVGQYTGNGSTTGPVVVTGFKPRFLLIKNASLAGSNWFIFDSERSPSNPVKLNLKPNLSDAEETDSSGTVDFNENGFQIKSSGTHPNGNGNTIIYLAIGDDEIGSDEDCLVDVPNAVTADEDATDTTGGYQRGNYATFNPIEDAAGGGNASLSNGNLQIDGSSSEQFRAATIAVSSGKWYFEIVQSAGTDFGPGVWAYPLASPSSQFYQNENYRYNSNGGVYDESAKITDYSSFAVGDVIGTALDMDNGKVYFSKNGVWQNNGDPSGTNPAASGLTGQWIFGASTNGNSTVLNANFGQMRFKYPIPSGYAALNTTALPAATIADGSAYFDAKLYDGNGGTNAITGFEFSPDFVWLKRRSGAKDHSLFDTVRGVYLQLFTNYNNAEASKDSSLTSFDSNGFTLGLSNRQNENGYTNVAWAWDAGSSTVSNTDGSITSNVRANPTAGFSIVSYTGSGSNATVGHSLNAALDFIIVKRRSAAGEWRCWHNALSNTQGIDLNSTGAAFTDDSFNDTIPTNSVFSLKGGVGNVNASSATYIAYCFTSVAGYSAFGSYTGNGSSDGPFVYTGFRPRWLMIKRTDSTSNWVIVDAARSSFNEVNDLLYAEQSLAETVDDGNNGIDFLSNGFKLRKGVGGTNVNGATLIYIAFASNPFQANGGLAR